MEGMQVLLIRSNKNFGRSIHFASSYTNLGVPRQKRFILILESDPVENEIGAVILLKTAL